MQKYLKSVFPKVLKTLQDIWSGKLTDFTRPGTSLPDRKNIYIIITQNQNFDHLSILFIVKQLYIVI